MMPTVERMAAQMALELAALTPPADPARRD
jgi:hypothetical protein